VAKLTPADLNAFHDSWLRPDNATIFVVGDTTLAGIMPLLEKSFGDWRTTGPKPAKDFSTPIAPQVGRIMLFDRPNTPTSLIFAGQILPVKGTDDLTALMEANDVLGGSFLSRLNSDLRETKHWSYGVAGFVSRVQHRVPYLIYAPVQTDKTGASIAAMRDDISAFLNGKGVTPEEMSRTIDGAVRELPGQFETADAVPYLIYAPVQTDKTGASIAAMRDDISAFLGGKGVTPEEMSRTIDGAVRELPGQFETADAVMGGMEANVLYHRPDNYYETLASRYRALTAASMDAAAKAAIDPAKLTWVVVGDAAKVKPQLETLGIPVEVVKAP